MTSTGTQTTEGTGLKIPSISGVRKMNTLQLIKEQIDKASALHDAQITHTAYRGVEYQSKQGGERTHGKFCYRGRTYVK